MIKPLLVNTYFGSGAAKACFRLHTALRTTGIDSCLLIKETGSFNGDNVYIYQPDYNFPTLSQKVKNKTLNILKELKLVKPSSMLDKKKKEQELFISSRAKELEMFSFPGSTCDITTDINYSKASHINLHWVANFLDFETFFQKNSKPVIWTLHDMNPFLGGEHYNESYLGMDENGRPVKRILTQFEKDMHHSIITKKRKALQSVSNLHLVSPSNWLAEEANKSELFSRFKITVIQNSVDTNIFVKRDRIFSRDLLGIPQDRIVLLFVADSLNNGRKGYEYLLKAFSKITRKDVLLCAIGNSVATAKQQENILELGRIDDERLMSVVYSAANAFIIPSLMDNLPNTILESLCCGTPVIGFPIGGIPELIIHGQNGYLTEKLSVNSLAETTSLFINTHEKFNSEQISEQASSKFSGKLQANAYKQVFEATYS